MSNENSNKRLRSDNSESKHEPSNSIVQLSNLSTQRSISLTGQKKPIRYSIEELLRMKKSKNIPKFIQDSFACQNGERWDPCNNDTNTDYLKSLKDLFPNNAVTQNQNPTNNYEEEKPISRVKSNSSSPYSDEELSQLSESNEETINIFQPNYHD